VNPFKLQQQQAIDWLPYDEKGWIRFCLLNVPNGFKIRLNFISSSLKAKEKSWP